MRTTDTLTPLFALWLLPACAYGAETLGRGEVRITSPREGAHPHSAYVLVAGVAAPRAELVISVDGRKSGETLAGESGQWEKTILAGEGPHRISVRPDGAASPEAAIQVVNETRANPPRAEVRYDLLRVADILLSHSVGSEQDGLYSPTFTHVGLFVGGDEDGAPLIAEAVDEAFSEGPAVLRITTVEQSLAYTAGHDVRLYRPMSALTASQRAAIAKWARKVIQDGAQFWTTRDFGLVYRAWALWDRRRGRPLDEERFRRVLRSMDELKGATDRFNCATLVWRAYLAGTGGAVDLATPNSKFEYPGAPPEVAKFFRRLEPHFLTPDLLYASGKLALVH